MNIQQLIQPALVFIALAFITITVNAESKLDKAEHIEKLDKISTFRIPDQTIGYNGSLTPGSKKPVINLRSPSTNSPGNIIGSTYAEYQQTGGIGRKIALGYPQDEYTHMIWLSQDTLGEDANIGIYYQVYEMGNYAYSAGGIPASNLPNTVESSLGILADNRAVIGSGPDFYNSDPVANIEYELFPGVFVDHYLQPDTLAAWYVHGMRTLFPATEVHFGTDTVIYVLTSADTSSIGDGDWLYHVLYRKVGDGGFDNGRMIESRIGMFHTIVARQNTDSVVMIYFDYTWEVSSEDYSDRDIVYRLSTDQGISWEAQKSISKYTPDSLWRAYSDVSALWDDYGDLHVVWNTREKDSLGYWFYKCRIVHWSTADEQTSIITEARYFAECHSNAFDMNAGKPSISLCEDNLYVVWTQYNDYDPLNDCSEFGYANGELYMSASDDYGLTWDTAVNLTQTRTPNCMAGECESDIFPSITRYGVEYPDARDSLDIIYINDKDAGRAHLNEGDWTLNNVMHYRIPCGDVANTSYCKPGDANGDGEVNVGDAVYMISYIFSGGPPPSPFEICSGDANGDCQCNVGDAVYIISYVFQGGAAPVELYDWYNTCGLP
jgi:hypothetical protein